MKNLYVALSQKKAEGLVKVQRERPEVTDADMRNAAKHLLDTRGRKHGTAQWMPLVGGLEMFAWGLMVVPLYRGKPLFSGRRF